MNDSKTEQKAPETCCNEKQPGFFGRMIQKLDASMKQKADEKSQQSSCCGSDDKADKCC